MPHQNSAQKVKSAERNLPGKSDHSKPAHASVSTGLKNRTQPDEEMAEESGAANERPTDKAQLAQSTTGKLQSVAAKLAARVEAATSAEGDKKHDG